MSAPTNGHCRTRLLRRVVAGVVAYACIASPPAARAVEPNGYRQPPEDIVAVLSAPKPPLISVAPGGKHAVLLDPEVYTRLEDLARPAIRLNRRRLDPGNHARRNMVHYSGLALVDLDTGTSRRLAFEGEVRIGFPQWSPRGRRLAFAVLTPTRVELWRAGIGDDAPARLTGARLNAAAGRSFHWMPDGRHILLRLVPESSNALPRPPLRASGPTVMETSGPRRATIGRGVERRSAYERALFEYFMRSQLALADSRTGRITEIGEPGPYTAMVPSPDGRFILITRATPPGDRRPRAAPSRAYEIWNSDGAIVTTLSTPAHAAPRRERRGFAWRHTAASTLRWIEGAFPRDGLREPTQAERIMISEAPFDEAPREVFRSESTITGIEWIEASDLAIVHEYDENARRANAWLVELGRDAAEPRRMWSHGIDRRYGDPGRAITKRNAAGREVVARDGARILLSAKGATPQGERPYVARLSLDTIQTEVLWRSTEGRYETAVALLDVDGPGLLIRHESPYAPPNYAVENTRDGFRRELTDFRLPAVDAFKVEKKVITFPRADGVLLQATLYAPATRAGHERLPLVLWAYPRSYADAQSAGQVAPGGDRFSVFDRAIPAFLAMRGFAVMDELSVPIVDTGDVGGEGFVEQVIASAKAAIDKAVDMGIADPGRVGVAGHSYGAFMTVTLLARSPLFKAGVALSGAYNRTLTPFGFQTERRTLWEAPGTYLEMSPFMHAHRIDAPLLLIHGGQDGNAGTEPMQSRRLFQAIRGHGGVARLVVLPYEGHVYRARESVLHSAAEMLDWFSLHLRRASRTATAGPSAASG